LEPEVGSGEGVGGQKRKRPGRLLRPTAQGAHLGFVKPSSGLYLDAPGVGPAKGQNKQQSEVQASSHTTDTFSDAGIISQSGITARYLPGGGGTALIGGADGSGARFELLSVDAFVIGAGELFAAGDACAAGASSSPLAT